MMKVNLYVVAGGILLIAFVYATKAILLPFVFGFGVAYLLDPLADKLESMRCPRWLAAALMLAAFFLGVIAILFALAPLLREQISGLLENIPRYISAIRPLLDEWLSRAGQSFGVEVQADTESLVAAAADQSIARLGQLFANFVSGGVAFLNLLMLLLISPVVAFFLLRDWDLIVAKIDSWIPRENVETVRLLARRIDRALAGFVRGQTIVALIMMVLYGAGWSMVGLDYALILGLLAGILAYVPFVGALFAALLALLLAFGQFGSDWLALAQVFGVFVVVQIIEGGFLTPRIIGSRVGLHPVWVLFAIFAGGQIMGLVGILIALPVAAAIGVLVRFAVERYLESDLHKGSEEAPSSQ
jgi:predicted PurR-regulated permease PerM